jgi:hypothetical protein
VRTVCMRTHMVDRTYTALWGLDRHNQSSQLPYLKLCGNAAATDQLCLSINEVNVLGYKGIWGAVTQGKRAPDFFLPYNKKRQDLHLSLYSKYFSEKTS